MSANVLNKTELAMVKRLTALIAAGRRAEAKRVGGDWVRAAKSRSAKANRIACISRVRHYPYVI